MYFKIILQLLRPKLCFVPPKKISLGGPGCDISVMQ